MSREPIEHTSGLVLRGIGLVYAVAFASLGVQVLGLMGSEGILPVVDTLDQVQSRLGRKGWWWLPSVFWFNASDGVLVGGCIVGALLGLGVCAGRLRTPWVMLALWGLYLSFCGVGGVFLNFQWDALLLEAGLVGVFLVGPSAKGSWLAVWILRLLLFKLLLFSGLAKLLSGDVSWLDATALDFHFFTQPLPGQISWRLHHAPSWVREAGVWLTFLVEIPLAFLALGPARARVVCWIGTCVLMGLIMLTGSYGFFNLLTVVLAFSLLNDDQIRKAWKRLPSSGSPLADPGLTRLFLVVWVLFSVLAGGRSLLRQDWVPESMQPGVRLVSGLRSFNGYGLFRVMTRTRPELILEVSADGEVWEAWPNRWKPWSADIAPRGSGFHMPRLDWQLWFEALAVQRNRRSPWAHAFLLGVLEGREPVIGLLGPDPLGEAQPVAVRMRVDDFRFSSPDWREQSGQWWFTETQGLYGPPIGLVR